MDITLDQAEALDAVARHGTVQQAAKSLNKGHSAVLYLIQTLEEQTGLTLFDRRGYRNSLNSHGEVVLKYCRELLSTKNELQAICSRLQGGWEPQVQLIYDGVVDFNIIADAIKLLNRQEIPSEIKIQAAYLKDVEKAFVQEKADLMVTILPIDLPDIESIKLDSVDMHLVAHKNHPLHNSNPKKRLTTKDLSQQPYIMIRETSDLLGLSTERLPFKSAMIVNDFPTKREAIMKGLGFGWLPDYLMEKQLKTGELRVLKTEIENHHRFHPRLYHYKKERLGRGTELLIKYFAGQSNKN